MTPPRFAAFFDASVLIAASAVPDGSSALAITWCRRSQIPGVVTGEVLQEALSSIVESLDDSRLARFCQLIAAMKPHIAAPAMPEMVERYVPLVGEDAPALASALACEAIYLFTLSSRLIDAGLSARGFTILVMHPREYLRTCARDRPTDATPAFPRQRNGEDCQKSS